MKTFFISIFLGLGSQEFLGIVWDLVEFLGLGLGLNSENFGIGTGIEFENFWDWDSFADPWLSMITYQETICCVVKTGSIK